MHLNDKVYDLGKSTSQIYIPALGALYFGLSQIWGFPNGEEVVGTLALLGVFLGTVLGISRLDYTKSVNENAGVVVPNGVDPDTGTTNLQLVLFDTPEGILNKDKLVFRVGEEGETPKP